MPDVAWSYEEPRNFAEAVEGMICFFNERVDISVDGVAGGASADSLVGGLTRVLSMA